jgi:hypothetical protein
MKDGHDRDILYIYRPPTDTHVRPKETLDWLIQVPSPPCYKRFAEPIGAQPLLHMHRMHLYRSRSIALYKELHRLGREHDPALVLAIFLGHHKSIQSRYNFHGKLRRLFERAFRWYLTVWVISVIRRR